MKKIFEVCAIDTRSRKTKTTLVSEINAAKARATFERKNPILKVMCIYPQGVL